MGWSREEGGKRHALRVTAYRIFRVVTGDADKIFDPGLDNYVL